MTPSEGDSERATSLPSEAVAATRPAGGALQMGNVLAAVAELAAAHQDWERATRLFGGAGGVLERSGARNAASNRDEFREPLARCCEELDETVYEREWQAGWSLTEDAAWTLAEEAVAGCRPSTDPGLLTRRQLEVAQLVSAGKTNREIATELTISEHTAERHVENILRSLHVNSRVQIATWFVAYPG